MPPKSSAEVANSARGRARGEYPFINLDADSMIRRHEHRNRKVLERQRQESRIQNWYTPEMPQQAPSAWLAPAWLRQESCGPSADTPMSNTGILTQSIRPQDFKSGVNDELLAVPVVSDLGEDASLQAQMSLFAHHVLLPYLWPNGTRLVRTHFESLAHLALICAIAAVVRDDEGLLLHAHSLSSSAREHLRGLLEAGLGSTAVGLQTILDFCCIETVTGHSGQARVHLKMLRDLVGQNGGILCVESGLREDIISCDCYFALKSETRPLFPAKDWAIAKLHEAWLSKLQGLDPILPRDKGATLPLLLLSQDLRLVLEALRELFTVHSALVQGRLQQDDGLAEWCRWRKLYCVSRMADHYVNMSLYAHQHDSPEVEKFVALAAALLTNMVLGCPEPVSLALALLKRLQRLLRADSASTEQHEQRLLRLWAVYVGSLAERLHYGGSCSGSEYWFRMELVRLSRACKLQVLADLKGHLRQVLFSEDLQSKVDCQAPGRTFDLIPGLYTSCDISWRLPAVVENHPN